MRQTSNASAIHVAGSNTHDLANRESRNPEPEKELGTQFFKRCRGTFFLTGQESTNQAQTANMPGERNPVQDWVKFGMKLAEKRFQVDSVIQDVPDLLGALQVNFGIYVYRDSLESRAWLITTKSVPGISCYLSGITITPNVRQ